jgi:sulfur-carrier protein
MATIEIPGSLRKWTGGEGKFEHHATSVQAALGQLQDKFPELEIELENYARGRAPYLNIYLDGSDIRHLQGLDTRLEMKSVLKILTAIAGG